MKNVFSLRWVQFRDLIRYPDLEFEEEKISLICGESGCGKSALLKMLNRVEQPSEGEILYRGQPLAQMDPLKLRQEVLLVPQEVFLLDRSVQENFTFYHSALKRPAPDPVEMDKLLHIACADFTADADCSVLSGGQRQRAFLAIFLSLEAQVLLLDEPTAALDENTAARLFGNLRDHVKANGQTLLLVSHQKDLAAAYADQVFSFRREGKNVVIED